MIAIILNLYFNTTFVIRKLKTLQKLWSLQWKDKYAQMLRRRWEKLKA